MGTDGFQTHLFEDVRDRVANLCGGCQGEINNIEGYTQTLGGEGTDQLTDAGNLEGCLLDFFSAGVKGFAAGPLQGAVYHAGARDTYGDSGVCLLHAVECARHEGVVADGVREDDELGAAEAVCVRGQVCGGADGFTHELDGTHVNAGAGRSNVYGGADHVGFCERSRDGANQLLVSEGHAFVDEGTEATDEVHSDCFGCCVKGAGEFYVVLVTGGACHQCDGGDGDTLVDNRDAELSFDTFADADEVCSAAGDFVVDFAAGYFAVGVGAVEQGDTHSDGANVELLLLDHSEGF